MKISADVEKMHLSADLLSIEDEVMGDYKTYAHVMKKSAVLPLATFKSEVHKSVMKVLDNWSALHNSKPYSKPIEKAVQPPAKIVWGRTVSRPAPVRWGAHIPASRPEPKPESEEKPRDIGSVLFPNSNKPANTSSVYDTFLNVLSHKGK